MSKMTPQGKKTLFSFLLQLLKLVFTIGEKHVEKNAGKKDDKI